MEISKELLQRCLNVIYQYWFSGCACDDSKNHSDPDCEFINAHRLISELQKLGLKPPNYYELKDSSK